MRNLFKYKALIKRYYRDEKKVKGFIQVNTDTLDEGRDTILKWLCQEHGVDADFVDDFKVKMIPSI